MILTSFQFLIFVILTLGVYFLVPKKIKWVVLLISSLIFLFYDNFSLMTIFEALLVLITTYLCGLFIEKNKDSKASKRYLFLGIAIILGMLIYLKYTNLFLVTFNHICNLFKINHHFSLVKRTSLIGISYYSLIMISYLIDIYRGACKPEKNIFKFALFMSYFPILTSGPFIKYENVKDDLYEGHKFNYDRMLKGLLRILIGIFKILVISERVGLVVNPVFANYNSYSSMYLILAILLFPIQLYTNFSGSIDVIMGVSEIIGIKLPENFNCPFISRTITEFWRRWHITLGAWLKDYIFYPLLKSDFMQNLNTKYKATLGKKVAKKIPLYLSMLIMWIFIGIWHGGAYSYIIGAGLLQFLYIFLEDTLEPISIKITNKLKINREGFGYKLFQIIRTYLLFSFAMIFFKAASVSNAINIIKGVFINHKMIGTIFTTTDKIGNLMEIFVLIYSLISLFILEKVSYKEDVQTKILNCNIVARWLIIYIILFSIIIFGCYGAGYNPADFIYRQF